MQLSQALALGPREVVAFVGAGGKTSALYRLAHELLAAGQTVIATTTTHMWPPPPEAGWPLAVADDAAARHRLAAAALAQHRRVLVAAGLTAVGKLRGVDPCEVAAFRELAAAVLVEADGARGRPVKAPAPYEPVIPQAATLVVPVVGLQALEQPLGEGVAHRPQRLAQLLGVPLGAPISPGMLARLLLHQEGGLRGVPPGARVVPLCNQGDGDRARAAGRQVAARVLQAGDQVSRVVVGAVGTAPCQMEAWQPSAVIILAAGAARRFGRLKQTQEWQGQPLLARAVDAALASLADLVVVVLGCQADSAAAVLEARRSGRLRTVLNPAWEQGLASSLRAGLAGLPGAVQAAVFCPADQPLLSAREIDALLERHAATGAAIVAPCLRGEPRSPALFDRRLFAELAAHSGDVGGRVVLERHRQELVAVDVTDERPYLDVDTWADYQRLQHT